MRIRLRHRRRAVRRRLKLWRLRRRHAERATKGRFQMRKELGIVLLPDHLRILRRDVHCRQFEHDAQRQQEHRLKRTQPDPDQGEEHADVDQDGEAQKVPVHRQVAFYAVDRPDVGLHDEEDAGQAETYEAPLHGRGGDESLNDDILHIAWSFGHIVHAQGEVQDEDNVDPQRDPCQHRSDVVKRGHGQVQGSLRGRVPGRG
mmetsp:Transcript_124004/g.174934  ORF Transcript_124004/g.174934 Transcript_124004/m.174934 type:complete len:202 (-) Transcript_124004:25-630(-)